MNPPSTSLLLLLGLVGIGTAAPAGSKHNLYLVHCNPTTCPIGICQPGEFSMTAAALYRNGPLTSTMTSTTTTTPDALVQVSGYQPRWEGEKHTLKFPSDGKLTTNIQAGADLMEKGEIAGDATLGSEPFVCFRDGSTQFSIINSGTIYVCTTEYWCGSISV